MKVLMFHGWLSKAEYFDPKYASASRQHWFGWLIKQLGMRDIYAQASEIYQNYDPSYQKYLDELNRFEIDHQTVLIGHSCGGGFLLKYLMLNPEVKIKKLILVAPWVNPSRDVDSTIFDDFEISEQVLGQAEQVVLFSSSNDGDDVKESIRRIMKSCPTINKVDFENYGHFCFEDMGTEEFPELLKSITS